MTKRASETSSESGPRTNRARSRKAGAAPKKATEARSAINPSTLAALERLPRELAGQAGDIAPALEGLRRMAEESRAVLARAEADFEKLRAQANEYRLRFDPADWNAWLRLAELLRAANEDPVIRDSGPVSEFVGYLYEAIGDRGLELVQEGPLAALREVVEAGHNERQRAASQSAHKRTQPVRARVLAAFDARSAEWANYSRATDALWREFGSAPGFPWDEVATMRNWLTRTRPGVYASKPGRPKKQ